MTEPSRTNKTASPAPEVRRHYIERDCVVKHEGREFEARGAVVTPAVIVAYPAAGGILQDWHGQAIGTWRAVSIWKTPRSYLSATMSQIEAIVDGITYTGRGAGVGMIYKGKAKAKRRES